MQTEKIVSIKPLGKMKTVDIEVDSESHLFYGNGIVTHNSHSAGYAKIGYQTAYAKCHSPIMFYCNCLRDSIEQADGEDDVKKLVADAQSFGYKVNVPNILSLQENFYTDGEQLFFGLVNIKNVGKAVIKKLLPLVYQNL